MDASDAIDVIMNKDSDLSGLSDSSGDECDDELDLMNSDSDNDAFQMSVRPLATQLRRAARSLSDDSGSDDDSGADVLQASTASPALQPGPSQLRARRQNYVWQTTNRQPQTTVFAGMQGPTSKLNVNDIDSPYEYFRQIFDEEFLDLVVTQTNLYASQYLTKNMAQLSPRARARSWKPLTSNELEIFLGLVLLTGLVDKKGRLQSYWSKKTLIATPFFNETMSRDRFQLITAFLHFNDNEKMPNDCDDKIYKIRPVLDFLVNKWRELYGLGEHIAIDEGMLKWRGRLCFRVYNKDKPTKYGIKSYMLADSKSGYCWNMAIYHREKKTVKQTVHGLLAPKCLGMWHSLYMDNYYNSVELSEDLLEQKVHTIGTLRSNRGEPSEIRNPSNLARHEVIAKDNGKVMVLSWKDQRIVKALSTKHDATLVTIQRRKKGGHGAMENVEKPACICDYNEHMSGVDHVDQMISYYPCTRKTLKWTKKVFFYLMELSVHNSHVLFKAKSRNQNMKLYDFQMKLIRRLCQVSEQNDSSSGSTDDEAPPPKVPRHDPISRFRGGFKSHHIKSFPPSDGKKYPQRRCRFCKNNSVRKDTRYYCEECNVPLCKAPCFGDYHSKKHFAV